MESNIKLCNELSEIFKTAREVAKCEKLKEITTEHVVHLICNKYLLTRNDNCELALVSYFFDSVSTDDRFTFVERAETLHNLSKKYSSLSDVYSTDTISLSQELSNLLNKSGEELGKVGIFSLNKVPEIGIDIFMISVLKFSEERYGLLAGIEVDVEEYLGSVKEKLLEETLTSALMNGGPFSSPFSKDAINSTRSDVDSLLKDLGFSFKGDKTSSADEHIMSESAMKKDDEEFDKAGESEAINVSAVDPNSKTPFLDQFSYDMTKAAKNKVYDPVIGRAREIDQIIKVLCCRKKNNVILLGDPGCGKTAIIESLSQRIIGGNVPEELSEKRICSLDLNALVSGTKYRGEYEERLQGIIKEVCKNKNIIIYIDEFHNLIGNGSTSGSGDGANILKPYLARGEFQCIGSTTQEEYRRFVKDGALKRRFQSVQIDEPGIDETVEILKGISNKYEDFHKVKYPLATIKACVEFAGRYINDRFFPDKAIDLLDTAGAQVKLEIGKEKDTKDIDDLKKKIKSIKVDKMKAVSNQDFELAAKYRDDQIKEEANLGSLIQAKDKQNTRGKWPEVTVDSVASVISGMTGVPVDKIVQTDLGRLRSMKEELAGKVIGQETAVDTFVTVLQRNFLGFRDETKCIASILLTGPSGTGKTLICEEVAAGLFGSRDAFIKYNMGEMTSEHEVSKLIGSPAGYVGYEDEPLLLQVKRHPSSLVLFDEIEKAHPKIFDIFLNIMDKGEIVMNNGERVDFRNTIVVFTGNIGTSEMVKSKGLGFNKILDSAEKNKQNESIVQKAIKTTFRPEFVNRLTNMVTFNELGKPELIKIFGLEFAKLRARIKARGYSIKVTTALRDKIIGDCDTNFGARDLQRNIQKYVESEICGALLGVEDTEIKTITGMNLDWKDDAVVVGFAKKKVVETPQLVETKDEEVVEKK